MKTLRTLIAAIALTCALAFPTIAGEMSTGVAQTPPTRVTGDISTGINATAGASATGEIGTGAASTVDPVTEAVLSLLQSVLALF